MENPFLVNPTSLGNLGNVPIDYTGSALAWKNQADQIDAATLADLPRQREHARLKQEADLAAILSQTRGRDATTAHQEIVNQGAQRDFDVRKSIPMSEEVRGKLALMSREISDNELKDTINQVSQRAMVAQTPEERERWGQILDATYEMRKIKQAQAHAIALQEANNAAAKERSQIAADASVTASTNRKGSGVRTDFEGKLAAAKGDAARMVSIYEDEIARLKADGSAEAMAAVAGLQQRLAAVSPHYNRQQEDKTNKGQPYKNPQTGKWEIYRSGTQLGGNTNPVPQNTPTKPAVQPKIGATFTPEQQKKYADQLDWVQRNPDDPRAARILNAIESEIKGGR